MTRQEQLELIRQKCIAANPELIPNSRFLGNADGLSRPIRLADVLWATHKTKLWDFFQDNRADEQRVSVPKWFSDVITHWNLRKDDITKQTDECVAFLVELLK